MLKLTLLFVAIAAVAMAADTSASAAVPSSLVWMDGKDFSTFIFKIDSPGVDKPCPEMVKAALAKDQLFITNCGPQIDYGKVLAKETTWTFRIDGKEYTLTGAQLAEAVKKAVVESK